MNKKRFIRVLISVLLILNVINNNCLKVFASYQYRVHFAGDYARGVMVDMYVESGDSITLPECELIPPNDSEFFCWDINGKIYQPGDTYTVVGDTWVLARWKCKVIFYANNNYCDLKNGYDNYLYTKPNSEMVVPDCMFVHKNGCEFMYWKRNNQIVYPGDTIISNPIDMYLDAVWGNRVYFIDEDGLEKMDSVLVEAGFLGLFYLPSYNGEVKDGFEFDYWLVDGKEYDSVKMNPGRVINVQDTTYVKAIFKKVVPENNDSGKNESDKETSTNDNKSNSEEKKESVPSDKRPLPIGDNKKFSNEWVDGKWYNADGTQTYSGTLQWKSNATGWWVEDTDGWYPTDSWQKIDNVWYYFKPDGYMASNEYYNGYWFNADGSWDDKYLLSWKSNSTGWWVEDISGWWPSSSWLKIDGYWYYFDASGYMVSNCYIDGWWISADGVCY